MKQFLLRNTSVFLFLFVLVFHFVVVSFARPYQLVSQVGWLDPWAAVGFGQVFPDTPYQWHYYKESRFFSILYQWMLTNFNSNYYLLLQTFTVSIGGAIIFYFFRKISSSNFLSLALSCFITLSSLLWGDSAGGADYYNTLGNLFIILNLIVVLSFQSAPLSDSRIRKFGLLLGSLSYVALIEAPSGLIVVFCLQLSLFLWISLHFAHGFKTLMAVLKKLIGFQLLGGASILSLEAIFLMVFSQSPVRLLTGPKFLFDSLIDPSVQSYWWRKIDLKEALGTDYLRAFTILGILILLFFVLLVIVRKRSVVNSAKYLSIDYLIASLGSYAITWIILILLQATGRSVALTLGYFTTPFLITGLILILFFVCFLGSFHSRIVAFPGSIFTLFITVLVLLPFISPIQPSVNRNEDFKVCEQSRLDFRISALDLAKEIDRIFGPRGSLLMAADDEIFQEKIVSICSTLTGRPVSEALMSFSQLGFPGVSTLGKVRVGHQSDDYPHQYLSDPFERETKPSGCVLIWGLSKANRDQDALYTKLVGKNLELKNICSEPSE